MPLYRRRPRSAVHGGQAAPDWSVPRRHVSAGILRPRRPGARRRLLRVRAARHPYRRRRDRRGGRPLRRARSHRVGARPDGIVGLALPHRAGSSHRARHERRRARGQPAGRRDGRPRPQRRSAAAVRRTSPSTPPCAACRSTTSPDPIEVFADLARVLATGGTVRVHLLATGASRPRRSAGGSSRPTSNTARSSPTTSDCRAAGVSRSSSADRRCSISVIRCSRYGRAARLTSQLRGEVVERERLAPTGSPARTGSRGRQHARLLGRLHALRHDFEPEVVGERDHAAHDRGVVRVDASSSRTNVWSIFTRSIGNERRSVSDECPVPKSSSATLIPSSRAVAISRAAASTSGRIAVSVISIPI